MKQLTALALVLGSATVVACGAKPETSPATTTAPATQGSVVTLAISGMT